MTQNLFDDGAPERRQPQEEKAKPATSKTDKEDTSLDRLKNLEEKIAAAISKVKTLKEEKALIERRVKELEQQLNEKNEELERLSLEKITVKNQVEELLNELETLDLH